MTSIEGTSLGSRPADHPHWVPEVHQLAKSTQPSTP